MTASTDSLLLDDRQRAMLREMGVHVWQPRAVPPAAASAEPSAEVPAGAAIEAAGAAVPAAARGDVRRGAADDAPGDAPAASPAPAPMQPRTAVRPPAPVAPAATPASPAEVSPAVLRGDWQAFFPAPEGDDSQAPVWLVLVDSGSADPREGDAGRLLEAMLRAAGLHRGAQVWAATVGRAGEAGEPLAQALSQAVRTRRPAMVLTLGRLAAQAALGRTEPLGKLRGAVHAAGEVPLVASYEPAYLLRAQDDKARAWEDLCRALEAARQPARSLESAP